MSDSDSADDQSASVSVNAMDDLSVDDLDFMSGFLTAALDAPPQNAAVLT